MKAALAMFKEYPCKRRFALLGDMLEPVSYTHLRVGETVHEAGHVAGGGSVMHRRAEDEGVGSLGFLDGLVDHAAEDAALEMCIRDRSI